MEAARLIATSVLAYPKSPVEALDLTGNDHTLGDRGYSALCSLGLKEQPYSDPERNKLRWLATDRDLRECWAALDFEEVGCG